MAGLLLPMSKCPSNQRRVSTASLLTSRWLLQHQVGCKDPLTLAASLTNSGRSTQYPQSMCPPRSIRSPSIGVIRIITRTRISSSTAKSPRRVALVSLRMYSRCRLESTRTGRRCGHRSTIAGLFTSFHLTWLFITLLKEAPPPA